MRNLIKECAPWLNWKVAAIFAAAVVCIGFIVGADVGLLAIAGATPLLAIAACLVPCLVPLVLLRGKKEPAQNTTPATGGMMRPSRRAAATICYASLFASASSTYIHRSSTETLGTSMS